MSRNALSLAVVATLGVVLTAGSLAAQSADPSTTDDTMVDSPWFDVSWPKIEMPKLSWKPWGGDAKPAGASGDNPIADTLDKVSIASGRAARSVREGWGSMVSRLPFGPGSAPPGSRTASNDGPGFWSRLFAPEEPQGSQTVTEFLAQERVSQVR